MSGKLRRALPFLAVAGLAVAAGLWYFGFRTPPIPHRTLRIGYEHVPPVQIVSEGGPTGIAVETINEAARLIRQGHGMAGSSLDYLAQTVAQMTEIGITRSELHRLLRLVEQNAP